MKHKKLFFITAAASNVVSIAAAVVLTAAGNSLARSQGYNYVGDRWDSDGGCTQISCFLADDADFTTDVVKGVSANLSSSLKNISVLPEDGKRLIPEAYSTSVGQASFQSDTTTGRSEAMLMAVGGDFFMFRDFRLLSGSYFTDSDLMQDGAVIDRMLAWSLYGSDNVAGMSIYINGVKFYIAGVIDVPQTKAEQKTVGELPRAYISYEGAALINSVDEQTLKKITCYECICPDPVSNFAVNSVESYFNGSYRDKCKVVNNSTRFEPKIRASAYKELSDYAVRSDAIIYPYWENASRIVEFKLSSIYFYRRFTYIVPALTLAALVICLWKWWGKAWRKAVSKIFNGILKFNYERKQKKKT